jgi:hypothetical protein
MRGQSSIEYMFIVAVVLAIFGAVTFAQMINPTSEASRDTLRVSQARSACDAIANAINGVYGNAEGATKTVSVSLPATWNLHLIGSPPTLKLGVQTSRGIENVESNLKYAFDDSLLNISAGSYTVIVEWSGARTQGIDNRAIENNKIYIYINPAEAD